VVVVGHWLVVREGGYSVPPRRGSHQRATGTKRLPELATLMRRRR
jgi:hypothetical protein